MKEQIVQILTDAVVKLQATGSLAFEYLGLDSPGGLLIFLAFGIKCAFPLLHNWLQDAYPEATVTGTVMLSAFTTKLAIYALARGFAGTDILIQGYLGTRMVKSLCELYEVPVRELELEKLLTLTQGQVRTALPLLLAVAGNAAKAFPGVGTLAGGLMHAVAYGLIFDALGRAITRTLETRGELRPAPASLMFRDNLVNDAESQARKLLRLALDIRKEQRHND